MQHSSWWWNRESFVPRIEPLDAVILTTSMASRYLRSIVPSTVLPAETVSNRSVSPHLANGKSCRNNQVIYLITYFILFINVCIIAYNQQRAVLFSTYNVFFFRVDPNQFPKEIDVNVSSEILHFTRASREAQCIANNLLRSRDWLRFKVREEEATRPPPPRQPASVSAFRIFLPFLCPCGLTTPLSG